MVFSMAKTMEWTKLLSCERWGRKPDSPKASAETEDFRSTFDRDYGRILYSSAFRRLQDKTQVFPLGRNDYVRTRLTHSLEVAHVGSSLGKIVGEKLIDRHDELRERGMRPSHFAAIVSSACLAHDIGNPPFGHFGEAAIEAALKRENISRKFEGNAQGFRLLTRVGDPMAGKGLKLTAAVLGAFMKYPCTEKFSDANKHLLCAKKFGFIADDAEAARFVAEQTGMLPLDGADALGAWCRHPLAFLMEAADDLSYLIADIEDALVSKIIPFSSIREFLYPFINDKERSRAESILSDEGEESAMHYIRAVAIGSALRTASDVFLLREKELLAGTQNLPLLDDSPFAEAMKNLRKFSFAQVYNAQSVVEIELMGFRVIEALVEFFFAWVKDPSTAKGKKIGLMLHGSALDSADEEARLIHLLDVLSGMTDSFALATYRKLHGI